MRALQNVASIAVEAGDSSWRARCPVPTAAGSLMRSSTLLGLVAGVWTPVSRSTARDTHATVPVVASWD